MRRNPFDDYMTSGKVYRRCQKYWGRVVAEVAAAVGQSSTDWPPVLSRNSANGAEDRVEGRPICDGRNTELNRGFAIYQFPNVSGGVEVAAWLKRYKPEFPNFPNYLIINQSLTEASLKVVVRLLEKWMTPATTPDEMQDFLRQSGAKTDDSDFDRRTD